MRACAAAVLLTALAAATAALARDDPDPEPARDPAISADTHPDATPPGAAEKSADATPLTFLDSLDEARRIAESEHRPLLIVAVPDWYESPVWERIRRAALGDASGTARPLAEFVRVRIAESRDREVHVRHRLSFEGYPLAVVLSPEGVYLGRFSGLPADGAAAWPASVAAIPARAERIDELRRRLQASPEDSEILFELGKALSDAGEDERADALFERMERADPLAPAERLGEARYLRLRHRVVDLMEQGKHKDVEGLCLRWRRRFDEHARAPDVLLLQANARFLAGRADDARSLWQTIVDEHAGTPAAERAKKALVDLADAPEGPGEKARKPAK